MVEPAGNGMILFIVTVLMLVLSWPAVIARCLIRHGKGAIGLDDWLMVAGLVLFTVTCALVIMVCVHGAGYLSADLDPLDIMTGTKYYFIAQFAYVAATVPVKISICVALLRIAGFNTVFRYILHGISALTVLSAVIVIIVIANICHPAPALWGEAEGTCNYALNSGIGYFLSAESIVTDWTLAVLPTFMLYNVQLKRSLKISVATVLGLGAFASTATIVRLRFLVLYEEADEFMYGVAKIAVWSILEEGIGIIAGSMPMLRPLLQFIPFLSSAGRTSGDRPDTQGYQLTGPRIDRMHSDVTTTQGNNNGNGGGAAEAGLASKPSDGDSQKHILKETEFTVTSEACRRSERAHIHNERINGWGGSKERGM